MMRGDRDDVMDLLMVFPRKMNAVGRAVVNRYLKDTRIKPYHLMMIKCIGMSDGISQKGLCDNIPFDKSYISTGVRELIDMGFVVNESGGKVHSLRLTDAGRGIMAMGDMMLDMVERTLMDTITQDEREALCAIMHKIDERMDQLVADYSSKDDS